MVSDTFELVDAFGVPPKRILEILELMEALSTLLVFSLDSISSVTSAGASSSAASISSSFCESRELVEAFLLAVDTRELTEAFFELADAFLELAEARAETGCAPLSSSSSVRAAAVLLSAAAASFSSSSCPNSESGERVSVTVLFLKTRVSYSSVDVPELADARFELVSAFVSSAASSIFELVDGDLGDEESPNSMAEMRELTEAFLELAEGLPDAFWETSASSSSDTESKLTLSGVSASAGVGVAEAPNIRDEIRELIEALAAVTFGASSASSVSWVWSVASNSSSDSFSGAIWELREALALTLSIPISSSSSENASVVALLLMREVFETLLLLLLILELFDAFGSRPLTLELLEALGLATGVATVLFLETRELFEAFFFSASSTGNDSSALLSSPRSTFFFVL